MQTLRRRRPSLPTTVERSAARPVMLVTFDVPFDPEAASFAVDTSVESGQRLLVVNIAPVPLLPASLVLGYEYLPNEELDAALRAPAELAHSLGVDVERLRVCSPHPVDALLEVVTERDPGLLVIGPDRSKVRRRVYRKAARAVRDRAACLVWLAS